MIGPTPLASYIERLADGELFSVLVDVFTSALPLPIVALLTFGTIGVGYYLVQNRIIIPLVMFIIVGGVTIARAPTAYSAAAIAVIVLSIAGAGYVLFQRVRVS